MLSIVPAVRSVLAEIGGTRVGLIGTRVAITTRVYGAPPGFDGQDCGLPTVHGALAHVEAIAGTHAGLTLGLGSPGLAAGDLGLGAHPHRNENGG